MKINVKGPIISNDDKCIYDWFGMEATCPQDIILGIEKAAGQQIDVEINSGGGSILAGNEIYTALRDYQGRVNVKVIFAGSAASVIAMAGISEISPVGQIMIHNVSISGISGDYHDMDKASEILQSSNRALAAAYTAKTGKSEKEILNLMDKETWLTADKAVEMGFVDRIMFTELAASCYDQQIPRTVIEKTKQLLNNQKNKQMIKAQKELSLLEMGGIYE